MKRSEIKILVVDDEPSLARAISEAFKRTGYTSHIAETPDQARNVIKRTDIDVLVVDCMLPQINGVDLTAELQAVSSQKLKVILTSGIFKDRSFIKESIKKTNALAFLQKPFDLKECLGLVEEAYRDDLDPDRDGLSLLLSNPQASKKEILEVLTATQTAHGFDLPYLFSLALKSELSGHLNIVGQDQVSSTVSFHKGQICELSIEDKRSYFGVLLVEKGFSTEDEIEEILSQPGDQPIGQKLVEAHALSPHAITLVLKEQMLIRLSKTIQNQAVDISFSVAETLSSQTFIDLKDCQNSALDWVSSKLRPDWLKSKYLTWYENPIQIVISPSDLSGFRATDLFRSAPEALGYCNGENTLQEILELCPSSENDTLRFLHFMLISRFAFFTDRKRKTADYKGLLSRLRRMNLDQQGQDHFEVLGLNRKANLREVSRVYIDLAKTYHPDKIDALAPAEVKTLAQKVFSRISQAHEVLSNEKERLKYLRALESGVAEEALQGEALFEEARKHLAKGLHRKALELLLEIKKLKSRRSDLFIYIAWAKLKVGAPANKLTQLIEDVKKDLKEVPPEDRHQAPYLFVKGVFYRSIGDIRKAKMNLKHALAIDPYFLEAKRELVEIRPQEIHDERTFTADLTAAVSSLFGGGRKRKRR